MIQSVFVVLQMVRTIRKPIENFAALLNKLSKSVIDVNGNDSYALKADFIGEWTTLLEKMEDGQFCLRFTYQLATKSHQLEQWVQIIQWEIESIEA